MKTLLISIFSLLFIAAKAQNYSASLIPDSLKENASAVKRNEELRIIIKSPSKAILRQSYAITILNEAGDKYADYNSDYNKFYLSPTSEGTLYDEGGKEIRKMKKKDIGDFSRTTESSLIDDNRIKHFSFSCRSYPYTVEYSEEQEINGIFFLPDWRPVEGEMFSVQQSRFVVEAPKDYEFRFKQFNYDSKPVIEGNTYTWEVKNIPAIEYQPFCAPFEEITPSVFVAPDDFEIGGYKGNMSSWLRLGMFVSDLRKDRDQLPDNVKQDVHRLTANIPDREMKIKALYEYLQKNTRYISIQLGIGGWQPFDANYVATKGYGDCKALSNYMTALLKEAGIKANYVLISSGTGNKGAWEDFPSPYFNHAIMCVPGKDTLWMECTSQTVSFNYMGSFTGDRKALLIDDDGGHIVNTPHYSSSDNQQLRKTIAFIDGDGNLTADISTTYKGIEQDIPQQLINEISKEHRDKYLNNMFELPTYSVDRSDYQEIKGKIPVVKEELKITAPNYASATGRRLFIQPNILERNHARLQLDKPRKYPIVYPYSFRHEDTIIISLDGSYKAEDIPSNVTLKSKFGSYSLNYTFNNNKIIVSRVYEREANTYPAGDYPKFVDFYDEINKADHKRIVLVKD